MSKCDFDSQNAIGRGLTSDVFPWDAGCVLKLYHQGYAVEEVEREYNSTRAVHAMGLPVPAAHDIVVRNGRHGIVLDRIEGTSLFRLVQARPWTIRQRVQQLAEMHVQINSSKAPPELASQRQTIAGRIASDCRLDDVLKRIAQDQLERLPDGDSLCHGDFHPDNVLITSQGPVIIDWSGAARGVPAGDVASTCWLFENADLPQDASLIMHLILKTSRKLIRRAYLNRYLKSGLAGQPQIEEWATLTAAVRSRRVAQLKMRTGALAD
jgi:uncharacterized protein (TIGR02172 family)